jgi:sugar phosphate isomerase/epimerase
VKIGLFTDSLQDLSFPEALDWAAAHGIEAVELGTGNFSRAPHCNLDLLVKDNGSRNDLLAALEAKGLELSALNCNGNLLDPDLDRRKKSQATFFKTIELAKLLGIDRVVTMSGCPGESGGRYPNWITCTWQSEFIELLDRQWTDEVEPFWTRAGRIIADQAVKIAIEMHPGQIVHNTRTLLRLREVAGPHLGANFDPSHLFWQGMDPMVVLRALGKGFVFHVHAKDTKINPEEMALNGGLETRANSRVGDRSWDFRAVGYGHGEAWWRDFLSVLRMMDYDGVLSIEHEDRLMGSREGIIKSVEFLSRLVPRTLAESWLP